MFNRSAILLLLACVAFAAAASIADPLAMLKSRRSGRIVGGDTAEPGQFPHQVSVRLIGIYHTCGGSIISDRWVVTAGYCTYGFSIDELSINAGAHHLYQDGENYSISSIVIHPEFDIDLAYNDISLIQVDRPFVLSDRVAIIGFGSTEPIGVGIPARSSGWGTIDVLGNEPEYLQFLDLTTLGNLDCASRHTTWSHLINDGKLCAYSMSVGRGMCIGDTGSPLVVNGELAGILAWSVSCAIGRPDAFTRVSFYFNWITENIS